MNEGSRERIAAGFQVNIARVASLMAAYDALGTARAGRPSGQQTDVLNGIGFPDGPEKTKLKFTLGELHPYKGRTIDDVIRMAVQTKLQRSNYNSVAEVAAALERIGLEPAVLDSDQAELECIMKRRHLIVHRADKSSASTRGRGILLTVHLAKPTVEAWVRVVEAVGTRIVDALPSTSERPMPDLMNKLTIALQGLDLENPVIDVYRFDGSIMATIISDSYTEMDEAERQKRVWEALFVALTEEERAAVEFVFTFAPGEQEPTEEAV